MDNEIARLKAKLTEAVELLKDTTLTTVFPNHSVVAFLERYAEEVAVDKPIGVRLDYAARVQSYRLAGDGEGTKITLQLDNGIELPIATPMTYTDALNWGESVVGNAIYPKSVGEFQADPTGGTGRFEVTFNFDYTERKP